MTDVMSEEVLEEGTEEAVVEEISGIIYHKSKILLKAITRKDKNKWFDQLMIKRPNREQIAYIDSIVTAFDKLLHEYRGKGVADEKKVQEIGKMILKAPEMTSQIGKLIAHIVSTLEETDVRIEQTLDSSIKKNIKFIEKKQQEEKSRKEKESKMDALISHLQEDPVEDEYGSSPYELISGSGLQKNLMSGPNPGSERFDSFRNKFHPSSIINEDGNEDQEADTIEYQQGPIESSQRRGFVSNMSEPELPGQALQGLQFTDRLINPELDELNFYSQDDEYN